MNEIHTATHIGAVSLTVSDLTRSLAFYQERIGFQLHFRDNQSARLGVDGKDLLLLTGDPHARRAPGRTTGLYHFAILVPGRRQLARSLSRLVETNTPVQGFADHLVSEAIYLDDPDGNGIEIYRDRPREEWPVVNGNLRFGTEPLDLEGLSRETKGDLEAWSGLAPATIIGHIHLKVSQIAESEHYYRDVLGFQLIQRYGSAATFLSAGGYHHHIGANTWSGAGAPPPPEGAIGLRWFELLLPDEASLSAVTERLQDAGKVMQEVSGGVLTADPAGNGVLLRATGSAAIPDISGREAAAARVTLP